MQPPEAPIEIQSPRYIKADRAPSRNTTGRKIADKWLKDEQVLLRSDSARACRIKTRGVLRNSVARKKKRVKVGGRSVWKRPTYVKIKTVVPPSQKRVTSKVGTQVLDRACKFIKSRLQLNQRSKVGSVEIDVRGAVGPVRVLAPGPGHVAGYWKAFDLAHVQDPDEMIG